MTKRSTARMAKSSTVVDEDIQPTPFDLKAVTRSMQATLATASVMPVFDETSKRRRSDATDTSDSEPEAKIAKKEAKKTAKKEAKRDAKKEAKREAKASKHKAAEVETSEPMADAKDEPPAVVLPAVTVLPADTVLPTVTEEVLVAAKQPPADEPAKPTPTATPRKGASARPHSSVRPIPDELLMCTVLKVTDEPTLATVKPGQMCGVSADATVCGETHPGRDKACTGIRVLLCEQYDVEKRAFVVSPRPVCSPVYAYEQLLQTIPSEHVSQIEAVRATQAVWNQTIKQSLEDITARIGQANLQTVKSILKYGWPSLTIVNCLLRDFACPVDAGGRKCLQLIQTKCIAEVDSEVATRAMKDTQKNFTRVCREHVTPAAGMNLPITARGQRLASTAAVRQLGVFAMGSQANHIRDCVQHLVAVMAPAESSTLQLDEVDRAATTNYFRAFLRAMIDEANPSILEQLRQIGNTPPACLSVAYGLEDL